MRPETGSGRVLNIYMRPETGSGRVLKIYAPRDGFGEGFKNICAPGRVGGMVLNIYAPRDGLLYPILYIFIYLLGVRRVN